MNLSIQLPGFVALSAVAGLPNLLPVCTSLLQFSTAFKENTCVTYTDKLVVVLRIAHYSQERQK